MLKFTSVRNGLRLTKGAITHLKRNGINTPQKAEALDIVDVTRGTINTRIFTFRDKDNYLLKRLKIDENSESGVKNVQARFYEYLGEYQNNTEVTSENKETYRIITYIEKNYMDSL